MVSKTPSRLLNTWLSQNRSTLYPSARSHSSRILSIGSRTCCPPSSSTTTFFSRFTKSTTNRPTGCWRRNLKPPICLSLRCLHKCCSVSVEHFLSFLATPVRPFTPTLFPPPSRGRVSLAFGHVPERFFIKVIMITCRVRSIGWVGLFLRIFEWPGSPPAFFYRLPLRSADLLSLKRLCKSD